MIIDDIINELDKFIAKYKETKTNAEKGQSLRSNVKQALSEKGVQGTDSLEDSAIVESIKSLSTGGTSASTNFSIENLKYAGLLPSDFSKENVGEEDLVKINDTIIQNTQVISSADSVIFKDKVTGKELKINSSSVLPAYQKLLDKKKQFISTGYSNFRLYDLPIKLGENDFTVIITNNGVVREKDIALNITTELYSNKFIRLQFNVRNGIKIPGVVDDFTKYVAGFSQRRELLKVYTTLNSYSGLYNSTSIGVIKNLRNNVVKEVSLSMNFEVSVDALATKNDIPSSEKSERHNSFFFGKSDDSLRMSRSGMMFLFRINGGNVFSALDYQDGDTLELLISTPNQLGYADIITHYSTIYEYIRNSN